MAEPRVQTSLPLASSVPVTELVPIGSRSVLTISAVAALIAYVSSHIVGGTRKAPADTPSSVVVLRSGWIIFLLLAAVTSPLAVVLSTTAGVLVIYWAFGWLHFMWGPHRGIRIRPFQEVWPVVVAAVLVFGGLGGLLARQWVAPVGHFAFAEGVDYEDAHFIELGERRSMTLLVSCADDEGLIAVASSRVVSVDWMSDRPDRDLEWPQENSIAAMILEGDPAFTTVGDRCPGGS